ncbi:MAG: thiamine pyrophosphate-binding protein [Alphaproteobacteria bacterium]|nr:thiamine pyrophosphate-binding protein [Alphaproteobacteria bacterium]
MPDALINRPTGNQRTGGQILVDQLCIHGTDMAFGVPGESYLAVLDALHDSSVRYIICRQEGGAAMMAEAYGKLTGRPGICMVTRGPGATNASAGVHIAAQDSTPMILLIGQVARAMRDREAFQEIDYRQMFGGIAKWVTEIDHPARIPEIMARAYHTACSGRPGPVVIGLPEDMLTERSVTADAPRFQPVQAHPSVEDMARLQRLLSSARKPLAILGGGGWTPQSVKDIKTFIERFNLPTAASFRRQDILDNRSSCYIGHAGVSLKPPLSDRIQDADLLILIGTRLGEASSMGYELINIPAPRQTLVHIHADPQEIGVTYAPDLSINAGPAPFARAALRLKPIHNERWAGLTEAARQEYLDSLEPRELPGLINFTNVIRWVNDHVPDDAIITNGAGNYSVWLNNYYQYRDYKTQLAPVSGSMGYGTPAAVAAKLVHPERTVIAFAGDGCLLMTGQEMATAAQYGLKIIWILANNGMYGTIRMHQERDYPRRISGTDLANPDFADLARAYGGYGEVVETDEDFPAAFERAQAADTFSLLELRLDPEAITPTATIEELRSGAVVKR